MYPHSSLSLDESPQIARRALRVVVADDDRDTVLTLGMLLGDEGYVVGGVHKGDDVMPLVRRMRPDAVILDLGLPAQSGYAVAREIQTAYYAMQKPLLIALTGLYVGHSDRLLSQLTGFDHHLVKPYRPQDVLGLLRPLALPPAVNI